MSHYGTLRDYRFDVDEVDDIRSATLFSPTGEKIAKIHDVVFDHQNGQVQYLVADAGHDHYAIVPLDRVWRSIADDENFETDLTRADLERLPRFDDRDLEDEHKWQAHMKEHDKNLRKRSEKEEEEYKRRWHDGVVQHRHGSTHNITPEASEMPAVSGGTAGNESINAADLTPERISGKFPSQPPMFTPTVPGRTGIHPAGTIGHVEDARAGGVLEPRFRDEGFSRRLPPRFTRFENALHTRIREVRGKCNICGCEDGEKVA